MDYRQCVLIKKNDGEKNQTLQGWVPLPLAKKGKALRVELPVGWSAGWTVKKVYPERAKSHELGGDTIVFKEEAIAEDA